jgi:hypothetical protein
MKPQLQINVTFEQVLMLVKQLPKQEKIKLTKELEKEGIESMLSGFQKKFQAKNLSLETINEEVEIVRQQIYESKRY